MLKKFALVLAVALLGSVASAGAEPKPGGFMSSNVSWVAHIPLDAPGVGARVVRVVDPLLGPRTRLYATGSKGLSIYDVTLPTVPILLGTMPYPHWENEDVEVSADGKTVIIAFDIAGSLSIVIDASVPQAPHIVGRIASSQHTITCAVADCSYAYGSSGQIFDITNKAAPKVLSQRWFRAGIGGSHDLSRDASGYLISDSSPRLVLDPRTDPTNPTLVTTGPVPSARKLAYQHNNIRPRAEQWVPRAAGDTDPLLKPGELFLANGETNFTVSCDGSSNGPFATWSMKNFDKGAQMTPLSVFRPIANGNYIDGNPRVNALGCSGHWFTERDNIVAAAWYEHGTRFLKIDPQTGGITEVGYFQPVVGSASAAHWIDDEYVYTVDYVRGIDILRFDRAAAAPSQAELTASWLAKLDAAEAPLRAREQFVCRISQTAA